MLPPTGLPSIRLLQQHRHQRCLRAVVIHALYHGVLALFSCTMVYEKCKLKPRDLGLRSYWLFVIIPFSCFFLFFFLSFFDNFSSAYYRHAVIKNALPGIPRGSLLSVLINQAGMWLSHAQNKLEIPPSGLYRTHSRSLSTPYWTVPFRQSQLSDTFFSQTYSAPIIAERNPRNSFSILKFEHVDDDNLDWVLR